MENNTYTSQRIGLLIANSILTLFLVVNIIISYFIRLKLERLNGSLLTIEGMPTKMKIIMAVEILLNIVMPYPPLVNTTYQEYVYATKTYIDKRVDTVLIWLMFAFRFYHVVRPLILKSQFMENRAFRICKIYGHQCTLMFSAKSIFSESAATLMPIMYCWFVIMIGALIRFNEAQAYNQNNSLKNFTWFNSFWWSIVTMTTVGYGDFFPTTDMGRAVGIFWSFVGVFLSSLFVVGLLKYLEFNGGEEYSYYLLELLEKKKLMMIRLANMLTNMYHYNHRMSVSYLKRYSSSKNIFKEIAREIRISKIQTINANDEISKYVRVEMFKCKKLMNKIITKWKNSDLSKISMKNSIDEEIDKIIINKSQEDNKNQWNNI